MHWFQREPHTLSYTRHLSSAFGILLSVRRASSPRSMPMVESVGAKRRDRPPRCFILPGNIPVTTHGGAASVERWR